MQVGLRTEVVVNIALLLGAALLFSGFLLVKLTEKGLLEQQRSNLRRTMALLGSAIGEAAGSDGVAFSAGTAGLQPVLASLGMQEEVLAWRVIDQTGRAVAEMSVEPATEFLDVNPAAFDLRDVYEDIHYSSAWNPLAAAERSYIELAVPLSLAEAAPGALQVRFSLAALEQQVRQSQKLVLVYVLLFGTVLSMFGVYILNRNIVRPVRQLQLATADVAAGDLRSITVPDGPGEIHDLAESFNRMVRALAESRSETEAHITSLEQANQAVLQARDDLLRSEKMASVGHLSAGMAHEIGNPLGAIVGYLDLLKQDLTDPASKELVVRSQAEANRIDRLIRELLDYAAPDAVAAEDFDPVAALRETVAMVQHQGLLDELLIEDHCRSAASMVHMNRGQFIQVCINLILNARDAMAEGGSLHFSSSRSDRWVQLDIADEGGGMDAVTTRKIFDPFFTTKEPGKGTGLGLSVCQRIIEAAGGRIEVYSEVGSGSTFTLCLPLTTAWIREE